MVNIYLLSSCCVPQAPSTTVDHDQEPRALQNCKFANVVVLSYEKLVAQLDCSTPEDGTKAMLEEIAKVEGVVQTNIIAVVSPVHSASGGSLAPRPVNRGRAGPSRLHAARNGRSRRSSRSCSTPCPMMRQPQCGQTGANTWIAHSKLSKIMVRPPIFTSKLLS